MTDRPPPRGDGRIDLSAIDSADASRQDRVVAATLARIAANSRQSATDFSSLVMPYIRPAVAAAVLLAAVAVGTVVLADRPDPADQQQPVALLTNWADSRHVPTNGELLLAFQGYGGER
ncbi:MAG: hypothetical protein WD825_07020 [Gemmatimonadaceae bacterium]